MKKIAIKVHEADNVAVALENLSAGQSIEVDNQSLEAVTDTQAKHKFALKTFSPGDEIIMYGVVVGEARDIIEKGAVLTTKNTLHKTSKVIGKNAEFKWTAPKIDRWREKQFMGYHRYDGQVGTANVWLFFPLVFCENRNIEILKDVFEKELLNQSVNKHRLLLRSLINNDNGLEDDQIEKINQNIFDNIEVKFITHQAGCGGIRQDADSLAKLLAGYVKNPNVAGATVLSLGCQNLQIKIFKDALAKLGAVDNKPLLIYEQQQIGTVDEMLDTIIKDSFNAIKAANEMKRKPAPLSKLCIGLECGGSDGFSGISANPALGRVSDLIVSLGGTAILSEFPELSGVEQELVNRCVDEETANRFLSLMQSFEASAIAVGSGFDMNPSPGNIKDGLITDAMKSAGAAKKGGNSPVTDVLDYGDYTKNPGLNLLCTPGNDVESTTAMAGSGANIMLFTTGLGTPTGNPIVPVIKVASNSMLMEKMPDIIDVDTGGIVKGEKSIEAMGEEILDFIIEVASGRIKTKAMQLNQDDFIPWKRGVSL